MNKEEILNKYIDLIDKGYCSDCNELNCIDNLPHAKITHAIRELQQENQSLKKENKILRENTEHNDKVVDKVNWENMLLKKENEQLKEINEEHKKLNRELREENKKYKEVIDKAIKCIDYNTKYRKGSDIYQFVDIESEILEPLKFILELDEENGNAYLKEFNDWLKEVK